MTPKQINELRYTSTVILGIIVCVAMVWLAFHFEAHKSVHKLPSKAFIEIIK